MHYEVRSLDMAIMYLTDCTLATVEDLAMKKKPAMSELQRQISIAQLGLDWSKTLEEPLRDTRLIEVSEKFAGNVHDFAISLRPEGSKPIPEPQDSRRETPRSDAEALEYLVECTLATVASLALKKSRSKCEYERQIEMAQLGMNWVRDYGSDPKPGRRVEKIMNQGISVKGWASHYES